MQLCKINVLNYKFNLIGDANYIILGNVIIFWLGVNTF